MNRHLKKTYLGFALLMIFAFYGAALLTVGVGSFINRETTGILNGFLSLVPLFLMMGFWHLTCAAFRFYRTFRRLPSPVLAAD
jgi:hypothetical protein